MDGRNVEPRTVMWAVAEVFWEDLTGTKRAPATLEDTSPSGACLRVKTPITIGSEVTVKWHREQFSATARNCRRDGAEFLWGVRRGASRPVQSAPTKKAEVPEKSATTSLSEPVSVSATMVARPLTPAALRDAAWSAGPQRSARQLGIPHNQAQRAGVRVAEPVGRLAAVHVPHRPRGSSGDQERKPMESRGIFPKFWRRQQESASAPEKVMSKEAPVNKPDAAEDFSETETALLSYEDIYHAAGILSPRSGYGIHKVVDMLNSERIRDLARDVKRASVLMALDAAGTSADDLLQDATRRQQALEAYAAGQQKQLESFEARKATENTKIKAEMDRVAAHYAERIQHNNDLVAREKESLRNWQSAKQNENQRIAEVIELCTKQTVAAGGAQAASPEASGSTSATAQANQAAKASAGR
jgi:hypothetical protein